MVNSEPSVVAPAPSLSLAEQRILVAALRASLAARSPGLAVGLIETHISFVLLAGALAYKIKKAVDLGFLDFTRSAQRHFYCVEELRLNRRTAPALYLEVLPVTGSAAQPLLGGDGPPIDWALKMQAFAQDDLWDRLATRGALLPAHIDALALALAAFHRDAAVAGRDDPFGQAAAVRAPLLDSLLTLHTLCGTPAERERLAALSAWEATNFAALQAVFAQRLAAGFVRECHGDLHLGNVTEVGGHTTMFDALEFSAALRWTDVASDAAFMAMDLQAHGLARLAHRFVNAWVQASGDLAALPVLRYHGVYRALVRAKIAALRREQLGAAQAEARAAAAASVDRYLAVAAALGQPAVPRLFITHGCSGSGKTLLTQSLLELCGAIRIRADIERKRLFGLPALARSDAAVKAQLYSSDATEATQARLREGAALALASGSSVILDATFLTRRHRDEARAVAERHGAGFLIVDFTARAETLRQRVAQRAQRADDASEADTAILEAQLARAEPLGADEQASVFVFDAEPAFDEAAVAERWAVLLQSRIA